MMQKPSTRVSRSMMPSPDRASPGHVYCRHILSRRDMNGCKAAMHSTLRIQGVFVLRGEEKALYYSGKGDIPLSMFGVGVTLTVSVGLYAYT
eukprot:883706-Amorphochlora_amoeboformis.AAC.1